MCTSLALDPGGAYVVGIVLPPLRPCMNTNATPANSSVAIQCVAPPIGPRYPSMDPTRMGANPNAQQKK